MSRPRQRPGTVIRLEPCDLHHGTGRCHWRKGIGWVCNGCTRAMRRWLREHPGATPDNRVSYRNA